MMLSPQAARMGTVYTTLRQWPLRSLSSLTSAASGSSQASEWQRSSNSLLTTSHRFKSSSAAAVVDSYEESAAALSNLNDTTTQEVRADEAWKINLNREGDQVWWHGPRPAEWYTGQHTPETCPGAAAGIDGVSTLHSLPLPNLTSVTRQETLDYLDNSWTLYELLFSGLKNDEGFYRPPVHGLRHPQIFYYGHTACLYVNKLRLAGLLDQPVNEYFESIFEVGVDEMLWDDMHKNDQVWPTISEVHEYRKQVYQVVRKVIDDNLDDTKGIPVDSNHALWALFLGFEHERIHLETSSVLFRETALDLVQAPEHWPALHPSARKSSCTSNPVAGTHYPGENRLIPVADTVVDLGKPVAFPSFGWDNEYGERQVTVPAFSASEFMITNGEYYDFVSSGGYRDSKYWCDDGWAWRTHRNLKWPFFWQPAGPAGSHEYRLRTTFEVVDMPWDWPVDVTYYEAQAFCRWKQQQEKQDDNAPSYRILTEAEHHVLRPTENNLVAARHEASADPVMVTSGTAFATQANLNMAYGSQNPVHAFPPSHTGHYDITGNAWEWTEDHFNPLDGFRIHPVYDDFSTPCFDGKHSMIVGGSFMSTGDEASVFARFHFRPHFLQHSGFRLVRSLDAESPVPATHLGDTFGGQAARASANVYESDDSLHMYLGLHYPESGQAQGVAPILPHNQAPLHGVNFCQRVVDLLTRLQSGDSKSGRALDIGCAVGGASFALAERYDAVDAFDFSANFVHAARALQAGEKLTMRVPVEADLVETVPVVVDPPASVRNKVQFFTGDACQLESMQQMGTLTKYDGVVMSNLLCRLPDPVACLEGLGKIVNPDGIVVLVTPFSWLEEFTPRSEWLGGTYDPATGKAQPSADALEKVMQAQGFDRIHVEEMPLVIREHQRKYQYIVSQATGWKKRAE